MTPPWWSGLESHIAETREDALAAHQAAVHSGADIIAYTDGSLTEQGVGAAVVSPLGRQAVHIGSPATHTVYAAELRGIEMALTQIGNTFGLTSQCSHQAYTAIIFTDNQAAIQVCSAPGRSSGQYILSEITHQHLRYRNAAGIYSCIGSQVMKASTAMSVLTLLQKKLPTPQHPAV